MTVYEGLGGTAVRQQRMERISARARGMHAGRAVLGLVVMLLVALGRVAFWTAAGLWFVVSWCAAAVAEGWNEARQTRTDRRGDGN